VSITCLAAQLLDKQIKSRYNASQFLHIYLTILKTEFLMKKTELMIAALVAVGIGSIACACECPSDECDTKKVTIEATIDQEAAEEIAAKVTEALENSSEVRSVQTAVADDAECQLCQTKGCSCEKPKPVK
jgi:hypothetical protein